MRKVLAVLIGLLLCTVAVAGAGPIKTSVGTFTMTNVLFKKPCDRDVGGGYFISSYGNGDDKASLNFKAEANFELDDTRSINIKTGAQSSATGIKYFGMSAGLTQLYPTENGYRSSIFRTHSYTFMPYMFAIQQLLGGHVSDDGKSGYNQNKVILGDQEYNFGASGNDKGKSEKDTTVDESISGIQGFGWDNGFDYIDTVNECGMEYEGTMSTESILLVE